jgi:hypothetical protein
MIKIFISFKIYIYLVLISCFEGLFGQINEKNE